MPWTRKEEVTLQRVYLVGKEGKKLKVIDGL